VNNEEFPPNLGGMSVYLGRPIGEKRTLIKESMVPMVRAALPYVMVGVAFGFLFYLILH
jgi:hypothetical protein